MEPETVRLRVRQAEAAMRSLKHSGEDLLGRAVPLAPIEEGTLRGSAALAFIVNGRRFEGAGAYVAALAEAVGLARRGALRTIDVEVSFNTVYAGYQHERRDLVHPLGGQADYLGQPLRENSGRYARALELEQRRALRGDA